MGFQINDKADGISVSTGEETSKHAGSVGIKGRYVRELIPPNVGTGPHRKNVQALTLIVWSLAALSGTLAFFQPWFNISSNNRAAALGLVFPGAGFFASANVFGVVLLLLTWAAIPLSLFAWFGAGAIIFPLLVWGLSVFGAYVVTGDVVSESAGFFAPGILFTVFFFTNRSAAAGRITAFKKRLHRNEFIPQQLEEIDQEATRASIQEEEGELDLESLRRLQFLFDQAFQNLDDWSGFTKIDQFQTSALRYQIYQMMYCLGLYQAGYAPNCHAYVSEAFRKVIERSLTSTVLNFWKWERLAGKFSLDWDPVQKDNIMVTGFLLQGVMLYTANTGDMRYTEPESLVFNIEDKLAYKYAVQDLQESLLRQWSASPYCLIPCEPNWIYVMCNLQGMTGAVIYDRVFGTKSTEIILPSFEESLNTNFTEPSGSVLPIRSELTGFTIPGLCGASGDLATVIMGAGPLRNLSRRLWAIVRKENVRFDQKTGSLSLTGLVGADAIDQGNYRANEYAMYPYIAIAAAEHGDERLKEAAMLKFEQAWGLVTTSTGAKSLDLTKASTLMNYAALTATLIRPGGYERMVKKGPSNTALKGPILSEVPYPGVLVAKARSHMSTDLEIVLYPSADPGTFKLGISRLQPGKSYAYGMKTLMADGDGNLSLDILVDGRTHVHLKPVTI